jgi:glutaredoxin
MNNRRTIVYTRRGCHLCDEAVDLLRTYGLQPELVDVDGDPELRAKYNECVPVVVIDGKPRFRGRVNRVLLERVLAAPHPPK